MDRRSFLTGLLGAVGVAALATTLPRPAEALTGGPLDDLAPRSDALPPEIEAALEEDEGVEVAQYGYWPRHRRRHRRRRRYGRRHRRYHRRHHRRRRIRRRRWRNRCRWYWNRWGRRVRRCYRQPYWFWGWGW